jgi:hypothetical protein
LFCGFLENPLKIGRLAAQAGSVIDDLAVDLSGCKVDETQRFPQKTLRAFVLQGTPGRK